MELPVSAAPLSTPAPGARLRGRVHQILEVAAPGDTASSVFDISILTLIALNIAAMVVGTVPAIDARWGRELAAFEAVSVLIFSVEYLLRLWSAVADPRYRGAVRGRLRFARSPMAVVDLLAVLPFWLPFVGADLRVLRALRLFRLLRVAKLGRYTVALDVLRRVVAAKKEELAITFSLGGLLLLLSSSMMYFAENAAQPEVFSSIPAAMWWAVATLTTVGYGDVYPVTALGRLLGSAIAVLGIGMFALPTGILGAAFIEEIQRPHVGDRCPHCGK